MTGATEDNLDWSFLPWEMHAQYPFVHMFSSTGYVLPAGKKPKKNHSKGVLSHTHTCVYTVFVYTQIYRKMAYFLFVTLGAHTIGRKVGYTLID